MTQNWEEWWIHQKAVLPLFSVLPSNRTRGNWHKRKHWKFQPNMRKNCITLRVTERWNRLPRGVMESLFLDIFETHLDEVLCNLV